MTSSNSAEAEAFVARLDDIEAETLYFDWPVWARAEQLPPQGDWTTWLLIGGRGSGKTRAGAEWVRALAAAGVTPIALVGETMTEAIAVMVRGESGLMNIHPEAERPVLKGTSVFWPNGVEAMVMSAGDPDRFRGPQFAAAWCDELGCGAVDKGANQPNIFGDDKSAESGRPYFSDGTPDALIQRQFLRAHHRFWQDPANNPAGMVDVSRIYQWTWDARPFPAFPALMEVWSDGTNHRTGHWLTGRMGGMASDELAKAIAGEYGVTLVAEPAPPFIHGYVLTDATTGRDALGPLIEACGLSLRDGAGGLALGQPKRAATTPLDVEKLAREEGAVLSRRRGNLAEEAGRLALTFIDRERDYLAGTVTALRGAGPLAGESLPLALDLGGARIAAEQGLTARGPGRETVECALPPSKVAIEPGDVVSLAGVAEGPFEVTEMRDGLTRRVTARTLPAPAPVTTAADQRRATGGANFTRSLPLFMAAHLPAPPDNPLRTRLVMAAYAQPWLGSVAVTDQGTGATLTRLARSAVVGETVSAFLPGPVGIWDRMGVLTARLHAGHLAALDDVTVLAGANRLAIQTDGGDWEVVGFAAAELVAPSIYRLTRLLRGLDGTVQAIGPTRVGRPVMLLDPRTVVLPADQQWLGATANLRIYAGGNDLAGAAATVAMGLGPALPLAPVHLRARRMAANGDVTIGWTRCSRADGNGWSTGDAPLEHTPERYRLSILAGGTAIRSVDCDGPSATYDAAAQAADFGVLPAAFDFTISQLSPVLGTGHQAQGSFHG